MILNNVKEKLGKKKNSLFYQLVTDVVEFSQFGTRKQMQGVVVPVPHCVYSKRKFGLT